ncbi:SAM-dependent methyltransferase [Piscinibacter sakaiensis]|uniref:SAM-dependent methyltransferase n=1 Tax=Piscinibacter sakaiensis TaxID=1547922 RepID=UPI003AAD6E7B
MSAATPPETSPFADPAGTWNGRFSRPDYLFGTAPNEWLVEHASVWQPGDRVLCVADGEGRNSVWLAKRGLLIDAFDISEVGVDKARRLAAEQGVEVNFSVTDVDGFAWPREAYDGVAAIFVQFAHPALRERMFNRIVQSLKLGGTLVLQGYTPHQLDYGTGGPPFATHMYTRQLLREAFEDELEITTLREYDAVVNEGEGHSGRSALIGMVGRRR